MKMVRDSEKEANRSGTRAERSIIDIELALSTDEVIQIIKDRWLR